MRLMKMLQQRHLPDARLAKRAPEIQHDGLSFIRGKRIRLSIQAIQRKVDHCIAFLRRLLFLAEQAAANREKTGDHDCAQDEQLQPFLFANHSSSPDYSYI